ncbi:MAG: hypothetical protein ACJ71P_08940 [Nitrososphaeraceae archaeon]
MSTIFLSSLFMVLILQQQKMINELIAKVSADRTNSKSKDKT